jgi:hypothetical protein
MPDIAAAGQTAGQVAGDAAIGGGIVGGIIAIGKDIIKSLILRGPREAATKGFVGQKLDEAKEHADTAIEKALEKYPTIDKTQLMLQNQLIGCSKGFQEIKESMVSAIRAELKEHRDEYKRDISDMWKRLDVLADKK